MRLDFKRALELAYSAETADKYSKELQSRTSAEHQPRSQKNVFQVTRPREARLRVIVVGGGTTSPPLVSSRTPAVTTVVRWAI